MEFLCDGQGARNAVDLKPFSLLYTHSAISINEEMEFHSLPNIFTFFLIFLHVSYAFPSSAATPEILAKLRQQAIQQRVKRDASPISGQFQPLQFLLVLLKDEVTGDHAFVPPDFSKGDQRGPCPGLNALANHNYIPHNGVASVNATLFHNHNRC